jgi:hypothetical protein
MTVGPLELFVVGFDSDEVNPEIGAAIEDAVSTGAVRVIDLFFVRRDSNGIVTATDIEEAGDEYADAFAGLTDDLRELLTVDEAMTVGELLPINTAALVALIEHTWAARISEEIGEAGGRLLASQRINARLIDEVRGQVDEMIAAGRTRGQ